MSENGSEAECRLLGPHVETRTVIGSSKPAVATKFALVLPLVVNWNKGAGRTAEVWGVGVFPRNGDKPSYPNTRILNDLPRVRGRRGLGGVTRAS